MMPTGGGVSSRVNMKDRFLRVVSFFVVCILLRTGTGRSCRVDYTPIRVEVKYYIRLLKILLLLLLLSAIVSMAFTFVVRSSATFVTRTSYQCPSPHLAEKEFGLTAICPLVSYPAPVVAQGKPSCLHQRTC